MRRYWIDKKFCQNNIFKITQKDFHHICQVCRQGVGDQFELITQDKKAYLVKIISQKKKEALAHIIKQKKIPSLKRPFISLIISIPKWTIIDRILEKSVELGIFEVCPVISQHSFIKDINLIKISRKDRWEKIIRSTTAQCGRGDLMKINEPQHLKDFNFIKQQNNKHHLNLFAFEGHSHSNIKDFLKKSQDSLIKTCHVFVGPEGGFSEIERKNFQQLQIPSISLGKQVLKVETACLALLSIINYELERMD